MWKLCIRFGGVACVFLTLILVTQHRDFKTALRNYRAGTVYEPQNSWAAGDVDKVIVMAKTKREDTKWVVENLPDWQHAIYTVDDPTAALHTPSNKGHEAMAYLTYIIEHYASLPSILAFIHPHRGGYLSYWHAWHTDSAAFDNVASLRSLRLDYVQRNGYANLRCTAHPGCVPARDNTHVTPDVWRELFNATAMPDRIAVACCAQFAVSRAQVLARPLSDYLAFRRWLLDTGLDDAKSGRVMEYLWHVIFGRDAAYCPDPDVCYCNVYGQC